MSVQKEYSTYHGRLLAGMVANGRLADTFSFVNAGDESIAYGKGLVMVDKDTAELPSSTSTANDFAGIVKREFLRAYTESDNIGGVPSKRSGTMVAIGVVGVKVLEDVQKGDDVYWRVGATDTGGFANQLEQMPLYP